MATRDQQLPAGLPEVPLVYELQCAEPVPCDRCGGEAGYLCAREACAVDGYDQRRLLCGRCVADMFREGSL